VATVLLVCERRVWAAVRLSAYVYLAPAGGPSALAVPTAAFGGDAHGAEAFAAGFLPPIIPSLGCAPFWTVLVWKVEPVFVLSMGFLRVPVSVFFFVFSVLFICSIIWSHELRRRGKVRPGRDPRCPGKAIVRTGGRHVPEHTV